MDRQLLTGLIEIPNQVGNDEFEVENDEFEVEND